MKPIDSFPRIPLGIFPTPVHKLNKVRKLEFLLADAKKQGAELVFTTGGAQSNHAMLTAAAAGKLGMKAVLVLKKRGVTECVGNQLLEKLMGTEVRFVDTDDYADIYAEMDRIGRAMGRPYYKIPCGGSNAIGALGYVECAREIAGQGLHFDHIVCAEGSGGTMAGLALGAKLFLPGTTVHGMMVDTDPFDKITPALMRETADLMEIAPEITPADYPLRDMCGPGYAIASEAGNAAVRLMAEREGIFLDPVYTGKAFAGLLELAEEGVFGEEEDVLFLHSGGAGGLFAIRMED